MEKKTNDKLLAEIDFYKNACWYYIKKIENLERLEQEIIDFKERAKELINKYTNDDNIKRYDFDYLAYFFDKMD